MSDIIIVKPEKCTGCNACVRICPAPEANITRILDNGRFITSVNPQKCIACGECIGICKHGARDYIDDTEACMSNLAEEKTIILATPAIKAAYPRHWRGILNWFKKKGCLVYDASLGADICTWAHLRAIEFQKLSNVISQPCAAIVNYVQMYQPKLLQSLSTIHSPEACAAVYIRKNQKRTNPIALLSPCIAKKVEFEETGLIKYNVTLKKLMEYFEKNDIRIPVNDIGDFDYEFDGIQGQLGSIASRPGGLKDNLLFRNPDINIINSEGVQKVYPELDAYSNLPGQKRPELFDVMSCKYGCNKGPGTKNDQSSFDVISYMRMIERDAKAKTKSKGMFRAGEDKLFKQFDDELDLSDYIRSYKPAMPTPIPNNKDLEPVFESMGKTTEEQRNYDCHACGYNSCREMATAIYRGLNTPSNCIIHAKEVLISRQNDLSGHNERLAEVTTTCLELSDKLSHDIKEITNSMNTIDESTKKTSERAKVVNDLLKNVVLFCNKNSTMDSGSVKQLITILETTIKAFSALDDNIHTTNENSEIINNSIGQINSLIDNLNSTLHKGADEELASAKN